MLVQELETKREQLTQAINKLNKNGIERANAEKEYKVCLAKCVLRLKDEGMPSTLINLVVYGDKEVSLARLKRDIADVNYNTNQEFINAIKLELRLIEAQISREWSVSE